MKKRLFQSISIAIAALLFFSLYSPASQVYADQVKPTPPSWISPEEYIVYDDTYIYDPETWDAVLKLRKIVEEGGSTGTREFYDLKRQLGSTGDSARNFELMLIWYKAYLNTGKYDGESETWYITRELTSGTKEFQIATEWLGRSSVWSQGDISGTQEALLYLMEQPGFDRTAYLAHKDFDSIRHSPAFDGIFDIIISLDGQLLEVDTAPILENGRVLIPIRPVAECLGADIAWDQESKTVTLTRATDRIKLTIGKNAALVNGKEELLDMAPAIQNGRTLLPLRFVAETFSQKVDWDQGNKIVKIVENMGFAKDSNLLAWFTGTGGIAYAFGLSDPYLIGVEPRTASEVSSMRHRLSSMWGVNNRDELLETIDSIANAGHSYRFDFDVALFKSLSASEQKETLANAEGIDAYMWPFVMELDKKWGDKSVRAWDWFRVSYLCGWGYVSGYLTLEEAYDLFEPTAKNIRNTFTSWDEAADNYVDGYFYWSREDVNAPKNKYLLVRTTERIDESAKLKGKFKENSPLDPTVWKEPVRGVTP